MIPERILGENYKESHRSFSNGIIGEISGSTFGMNSKWMPGKLSESSPGGIFDEIPGRFS